MLNLVLKCKEKWSKLRITDLDQMVSIFKNSFFYFHTNKQKAFNAIKLAN